MVAFFPPRRWAGSLIGALLLVAPGCGRILGIEGAHVDPILDDDQTNSSDDDSDDEQDTVEVPQQSNDQNDDADETRPDAGDETEPSENPADTTAECMSFDNSRVKHLKSDGTLTPLPNANDAVR